MAAPDITAERLRELLDYDPETGVFIWKRPLSRRVKAGDVAGNHHPTLGYVLIGVEGKLYCGHRLAWLYIHGEWPAGVIDHINLQRADNRLCNLRVVTRRVNNENKVKAQSNSKSGLLGVATHKESGRFRVRIKAAGKTHQIGYFDDAEVAHAAYIDAKRRLHEGCTL